MRICCGGLHRASFEGYAKKLLLPGNKGVARTRLIPDNCPDDSDENIQEGLLLPVFESKSNEDAIVGLVLKLSDQGKDIYRRAGIFFAPLKESLIDKLGQIVDDGDEYLSRAYAEVLRDDYGVTLGYTIDII